METTGVIIAGEGESALAYINARRGLSPRQMKAILALSMFAVGVPLGWWWSGSWLTALITVEFAIIGLFVGNMVVQRLSGPSRRKAWAERGQTTEWPVTVRLTADALVYDLNDMTTMLRWHSITDVYLTRRYWVFMAQGIVVVPRRFFATTEVERAFISDVLSRMTEAARARSPDAVRFAGA